jgi:Flp pilus assembly protein TadG
MRDSRIQRIDLRAQASSERHFLQGERGSASVEFAMTAVVLFMTMIGLMKVCMGIYTFHYISEAAREATRYAMVHGSACSNSGVSCTTPANGSGITTYVNSLAYPGINPSLMTVTTSYAAYPTGATCTPSISCNNPGNLVTVKVQYAFPYSIPFMTAKTLNMQSTSAMVISQ